MDISTLSTLGAYGVQALSKLAQVSQSGGSGDGTGVAGVSGNPADTVSLSSEGQWTSRSQKTSPFKVDFDKLGSLLAAGDVDGAKQLYAAMQAKMKGHGHGHGKKAALGADFEALGKALDSGDPAAAKKAWETMQTDLQALAAQHEQGGNPFKEDMDKLGALIKAGDLQGAQTLFKSMAEKMGQAPAQGAPKASAAVSFKDLQTALDSGDLTAAKQAYDTLEELLKHGRARKHQELAAQATPSTQASTDLQALLTASRVGSASI